MLSFFFEIRFIPTFFLEKKGGKVNREAQNLLLPNDYNRVFAVLTFCYFGVKTKVEKQFFLIVKKILSVSKKCFFFASTKRNKKCLLKTHMLLIVN